MPTIPRFFNPNEKKMTDQELLELKTLNDTINLSVIKLRDLETEIKERQVLIAHYKKELRAARLRKLYINNQHPLNNKP